MTATKTPTQIHWDTHQLIKKVYVRHIRYKQRIPHGTIIRNAFKYALDHPQEVKDELKNWPVYMLSWHTYYFLHPYELEEIMELRVELNNDYTQAQIINAILLCYLKKAKDHPINEEE